jgi:hypothetical protein
MTRKILNQPGLRIGSSPTPRPHQQQNGKDDPKHFLACPLNTTQAGPLGSLHEMAAAHAVPGTRRPASLVACRRENIAGTSLYRDAI